VGHMVNVDENDLNVFLKALQTIIK